MKFLNKSRSQWLMAAGVAAGALLAVPQAKADLVGPYTADTNTLFLLHFDEASGGTSTLNYGTKGGSFYSCNLSSASATPPTVTTMLGGPGYVNEPTNFNGCMTNLTVGYLFGYDANKSGAYQGEGSAPAADALAMTNLNIGLGGQSPFTIEALIRPNSTSGNQEIVCTDSSASSRAFQFRITSGVLQFQFITGTIAASGTIPTSGSDAFVAGNWYHVAVVYDGTNATLYWTKLDPSNGAAHILGSPSKVNLGATQGAYTGPLCIGNENRSTAGETFYGCIDEVRISSVARAANQMQFYSPAVVITANPVSQNVDYNQPVTMSVSASSLTQLGYQWRFNSNVMTGFTNGSFTVSNVAASDAGYYDVVVTNTAGYSATSSVAHLVIGAANFLANRYSFTTDTTDSIGGQTGTNFGNAAVANGHLVLDGTTGTYMQLPANLFASSNATALTVEYWATYGVNPNNVYAFAFGYTNYVINSGIVGINYVTYSPHNSSGQTLSSSPSDPTFAQSVSAAGNFDGRTVHVACVIDPPNQALSVYTNGILEAVKTNFTVNLGNVNDQLSFIGRSLWAADPYLVANIDEIRIFKGALSSITIKQSFNQGADTVLADGPAKFVTEPISASIPAGQVATFTAAAVGYLPIAYQWYKNGVLVPGATDATYAFTTTQADNGSTIVCYATNTIGVTTYSATSSTAALTVFTPPTLAWMDSSHGGADSTWNTTSLDWTNDVAGGGIVAFSQTNGVLFDDRGAGSSSVDVAEKVALYGFKVNSSSDYTFLSSGGAGYLDGQANLVKLGSGKMTLDVSNNLTGGTFIGAGTLQVGNYDTAGSLSAGPVTNNSALVLARTDAINVGNVISGSGSLSVSGNVTVSSSNTYTGPTTVASGYAYLPTQNGFGSDSGALTVADGAQVYVTGNYDFGSKPLTVSGSGPDGNGALRKGGSGTTTYNGAVSLAGSATLYVDGSATLNLSNNVGPTASSDVTLTLGGAGTGNIAAPVNLQQGSLTVSGGTWTVASTNHYTGQTALNGGTLEIASFGALGALPSDFNQSQIYLNNGILGVVSNATLADGRRGLYVAGTTSALSVNTNATLVITNPIAGDSSANLIKRGAGKLVLDGVNTFGGFLYVDRGDTAATSADGMTVIAKTEALAGMPAGSGSWIWIRNNNSASSTLALDGTQAPVTIAPDISLAGRNVSVPTIENLAGDNTVSGNITLVSGGGNYWLQSDAGKLSFTQPLPYTITATSGRTLSFMGAGTIEVPIIQDAAGYPVSIVKAGTGVLNLTGASVYTGTTVVTNGVLQLSGSLGTNTVTVGGGWLVGNGSISGDVSVLSGGSIGAGTTNTTGTLTLGGALTLAGTTVAKVNKGAASRDLIAVTGSLTMGGTLAVTNLSGSLAAGDSFQLFSAGSFAGGFTNVVPATPGSGLAWNTNLLASSGVLSIVTGLPSYSTNLSFTVSGSTLTVKWPATHVGWILQAQTNSIGVGLSNNWVDLSDSTTVFEKQLTIAPGNGAVFFRLRHP
jgi:autotransporter-associated beta strand protein